MNDRDPLAPLMARIGQFFHDIAPMVAQLAIELGRTLVSLREAIGRMVAALKRAPRGLDSQSGRALRAGPQGLADLARDDTTLLSPDRDKPCTPKT